MRRQINEGALTHRLPFLIVLTILVASCSPVCGNVRIMSYTVKDFWLRFDGVLAREEKVTLVGFGTFQVMERKARTGRNPQTGETIQIPGKKVPKFVPGKSLRKAVE